MRYAILLAQLLSMVSLSVDASAGTVFAQVGGSYSRIQHKLSSWGVCLDEYHRRPEPIARITSDGVYAGYKSLVMLGEGCNRALDTIGDAVFHVGFYNFPNGLPWGPDRVRPDNLRLAIFEITSFRSASPQGVVSGPAACAPGDACPRPRPPSNCRFQLFAQTRPREINVSNPNNSADWEGPVSSVADLVRTHGRGYALVSETNRVNGGAWIVTDVVRQWLTEHRPRYFILTIADSEPSLSPEHRNKTVRCDGYFTAQLRIDHN